MQPPAGAGGVAMVRACGGGTVSTMEMSRPSWQGASAGSSVYRHRRRRGDVVGPRHVLGVVDAAASLPQKHPPGTGQVLGEAPQRWLRLTGIEKKTRKLRVKSSSSESSCETKPRPSGGPS